MTEKELAYRIEKLTPKQFELLGKTLDSKASVSDQASTHRNKLISFVVCENEISNNELTDHLRNLLPDQMIPNQYVQLREIPKLPNGKVNYNALRSSLKTTSVKSEPTVQSLNDVESKLVEIWEKVLQVKPVSVHDNYFEIGGDSIISIQLQAMARNEGILLSIDSFTKYQTISELAMSAQTVEDKGTKSNISRSGPVSLSPIQSWFFEEQNNAPHHWNLAMSLSMVDPNINIDQLEEIFICLINNHQALRQKFKKEDGEWASVIDDEIKELKIVEIKVDKIDSEKVFDEIKETTKKLQSEFDLSNGPLLKVIFVNHGIGKNQQVILISHHLIIDHVSWGILWRDVDQLIGKLYSNEAFNLIGNDPDYLTWIENLEATAAGSKLMSELPFWEAQVSNGSSIIVDTPVSLPILQSEIKTISSVVKQLNVKQLISNADKSYGISLEEVLLMSFFRALQIHQNQKRFCIGIEHNGRMTNDLSNLNVSDTIGWLTSFYILALETEIEVEIHDFILSVKELFRSVPNHGRGFGLLRYMNKNLNSKQKLEHAPEILFNYLGNINDSNYKWIKNVESWNIGSRSPQSESRSLLEINCWIQNEEVNLHMQYSGQAFKHSSIQSLMDILIENIREMSEHFRNRSGRTYSPSDFSNIDISQKDLDQLFN